MQTHVHAIIFGSWRMELDGAGDLTSYSLRTQHAAIRGYNFYQRQEPYYGSFMRLVDEVTHQPDFCLYPLSSHLTDSWLGGNLCLADQQTPSERWLSPHLMRCLYRQQLDWQTGVVNLMNHMSFRTELTRGKRVSLNGHEIESQLGTEGLAFHQLQNLLRFDSHLLSRPTRPASPWPDYHQGWLQMDQQGCDVTLPRL
jgi:hypothetical protein